MPYAYRHKTSVRRFNGVQIIAPQVVKPQFRRENILLAVRNMEEEIKKLPTREDWEMYGGVPSSKYILQKFGSWQQMLDEVKELPPKRVYTIERKRIR